jgi:hypothetical protein
LLKYPASKALWDRFGSKNEKSRFINWNSMKVKITISKRAFAKPTSWLKQSVMIKMKPTSSSSTKVLRITSISHVNISQAMKGNLENKSNLSETRNRSSPKKHLSTRKHFSSKSDILEGSFAFSILWRFLDNVSEQLLHLGSISQAAYNKLWWASTRINFMLCSQTVQRP